MNQKLLQESWYIGGNKYGMELINLEPQTTHGGSMRYFLAHKGFYQKSENVQKIINNEISLGLNKVSTFNKFSENVKKSKADLVNLLKNELHEILQIIKN